MKPSVYVGLLLLALAGCSDDGATSAVVPLPTAPRAATGGTPVITSAVAGAMFPTGSAEGIVDGLMYYDAHHASIAATVTLSGPTSTTRAFPAVLRHTTGFYGNQHSATFRVPVPTPCGHTLQGSVAFAVWGYAADGTREDGSGETRIASAAQAGCTSEEEETRPASEVLGGGGGGGDCPSCIQEPAEGPTWCRVRTKYYLDTGEIISQTILYCW